MLSCYALSVCDIEYSTYTAYIVKSIQIPYLKTLGAFAVMHTYKFKGTEMNTHTHKGCLTHTHRPNSQTQEVPNTVQTIAVSSGCVREIGELSKK